MKKILNFFANIILAIVYPNRILSFFRVKNLDQNSNKILGNDSIVRIIALIGALIFVVAIRYTPAPPADHQHPVSVLLNRIFDEEEYVILSGAIPQYVEVILTGDRTAIDLLATSGTIRAHVDLGALGEGTHSSVIIEVTNIPEYIRATVNPSIIEEVTIARIEEREMPVEVIPRLPDIGVASRYRLGEITIEPAYIAVRGPQVFLDEIDAVRVQFDISDQILEGSGFIRNELPLVAHSTLDTVRGVTFVPETVSVQIEVYEHVKSITLLPNQQFSNLPQNYDIISVVSDVDEVVVWGDIDNMDDIIALEQINFNELDDDGQIILEVTLPPDVYTEIDGEILTTIEVVVTVVYEAPTEAPTEPTQTLWLSRKKRDA